MHPSTWTDVGSQPASSPIYNDSPFTQMVCSRNVGGTEAGGGAQNALALFEHGD